MVMKLNLSFGVHFEAQGAVVALGLRKREIQDAQAVPPSNHQGSVFYLYYFYFFVANNAYPL